VHRSQVLVSLNGSLRSYAVVALQSRDFGLDIWQPVGVLPQSLRLNDPALGTKDGKED
jgi:hypothetical protein